MDVLGAVTTETGASIPDLDATFLQMKTVPFDGLLGMDFLRQNEVYVDFRSKELFLHRAF